MSAAATVRHPQRKPSLERARAARSVVPLVKDGASGWMLLLDPSCRMKFLVEKNDEVTGEVLRRAFTNLDSALLYFKSRCYDG